MFWNSETSILSPGAMGESAFIPSDITSLAYWWDVDDATTDTTGVTAWVDKINSVSFFVYGSPNVITTPGGADGFQLNTTDRFESIGNLNLQYSTGTDNDLHVFYIFGDITPNSSNATCKLLQATDLPDWRQASTTAFLGSHADANARLTGSATHTATNAPFGNGSTTFQLAEYQISETAGTIKIYVDGVEETSCTHYDDTFIDDNINYGTSIGPTWTCGDLLFYQGILSGTDLTNVRNYLTNKFIS